MASIALRRMATTALEALRTYNARLVADQLVAPMSTSQALSAKKKKKGPPMCPSPLDKCKADQKKCKQALKRCKLEQECAKLAAEKKKEAAAKKKCGGKKSKKSK